MVWALLYALQLAGEVRKGETKPSTTYYLPQSQALGSDHLVAISVILDCLDGVSLDSVHDLVDPTAS